MPAHSIDSVKSLRKLIAEPPAMMKKRLQSQIDDYCLTIIQHSSVCAVGFSDPSLDIAFFNLRDIPVLRAEGESIDLAWPAERSVPAALEQGLGCSLYFTMPGIGFALRANGRCVVRGTGGARVLAFRADALFLHCSRAKVRAQFWTPRAPALPLCEAEGGGQLSAEALGFIAASPYLLMLTRNAAGATEISPRGDPDGFVLALDDRTLLIPERPGNKVACTLINILSAPTVTVSFIIPGGGSQLSVTGKSWLSADQSLLAPLAINGKVPVVAIVLEVERWRFVPCPELVAAGLWRSETHLRDSDLPSFPKMLSEHMNGRGLLGKATTLLVDAVVKHDLKNLY
ncbi:hypothetical protein [Pseudomonas sp. NPDC087626]|uniref:hypothetical protein n=1 Tax=unclassified Pseudomonas TaxID=196821 RepID=UPI003809B807